jgi:hypothetical protein
LFVAVNQTNSAVIATPRTVHQVKENIVEKTLEVMRFSNGKRYRAGQVALIAGTWHAFKGPQNNYVGGGYRDHVTAGNKI